MVRLVGLRWTYSSNTLRWFSEWQPLPSEVVGWLSQQVDNTLLTGGTLDGTKRLASEHSILLLRSLVVLALCHQQIVQVLDLYSKQQQYKKNSVEKHTFWGTYILLKAEEFLAHLILVGEHVSQVVHQLLKLVHQAGFELLEFNL